MHMQMCKFIDFCTSVCAFLAFINFRLLNKITGSISR